MASTAVSSTLNSSDSAGIGLIVPLTMAARR
jgi:hypothetical protein